MRGLMEVLSSLGRRDLASLASPYQFCCCAIPFGECRWHVDSQSKHHRQMSVDGQECWRMWKASPIAFAKNHRLNATKNSGERDSKCNKKERSCPRVLSHCRCENEKFAREDSERRHTENRQRPEHEPPANSRAGGHQASNPIHLLRTGLLRSVTCSEEDGRLRKRVNGHVEQRRKISDRPTKAKCESDDAHVFNRGITEEPFDISLPPNEESAEHSRQKSKRHEHSARKNVTDGTLDEHLATNDRVQRNIKEKTGEHRRDRSGTFSVSVGKPVVQRGEPNFCSISNQ